MLSPLSFSLIRDNIDNISSYQIPDYAFVFLVFMS